MALKLLDTRIPTGDRSSDSGSVRVFAVKHRTANLYWTPGRHTEPGKWGPLCTARTYATAGYARMAQMHVWRGVPTVIVALRITIDE